ncbi:MAG: DUF1080 domain-containing protein [Cyclobacteriaceae bacterium]|nr:DUF1080 domain-containing protein [Cytophagales bacterium]HNP76434.1 DUF1080 domain-containing protein [Cyclobacteriaceae bacterium]
MTLSRTFPILYFTGILLAAEGCSSPAGMPLFNGRDLSGWDTYIAPASDSTPPPGLNHDPNGVFTVTQVDGAPAIRVSGVQYGGLSTQQEYHNYHLKLEFKWGVAKIPSFANRKRDSGVLYHAVGPHGVDARAWMRSQEFQVQEGDCGDYWGVAGATFDIPAVKNAQDQWVYDEKGDRMTFRDSTLVGRRCIKGLDAEKPYGEWNSLEIICFANSSIHILNGKVVMRLYNSSQVIDGELRPLASGKIQLQSEGCEVFYRNIALTPIESVPAAFQIP